MYQKKIKSNNSLRVLYITIGAISYRVVLDLLYCAFIVPVYGYDLFDLQFNPLKYIESLFWYGILFLIIKREEHSVSSFFLNLQFLVMLAPMLSYYALADQPALFMRVICICFLFQIFFLQNIKNFKLPYFKGNFFILIMALSFFCALVIIISLAYNGLPSLKAFNFNDIYELRATARTPALFGYFINWVCKITIPFLLTFSLYYQRKKLFIFSIVVQLLMFMTYAHKTFLLILPAMIVIYYVVEKNKINLRLYQCLPVVLVAAFLLYIINNDWIMAPSVLVRRFLFVPAQLKFQYYDFFLNHPKVYFADGLIGTLFSIESPYGMNVPNVIAFFYHGRIYGANTGYWGDAYANLGIAGVVIFSIVLAFIVKLIESITTNIPKAIVLPSLMFIFLNLNDQALLTTLLTGGLWLLIVLLYLFDSYLYFQKEENSSAALAKKCKYIML